MSTARKHVNFLRIVGALALSLIINIGLLYGINYLLEQQMKTSAMQTPFYVVCALSTLLMFFLLLFPANRPFRRFKTFMRWFLVIVVALAVWAGGSIWNLQNDMIYLPKLYDQDSEQKALSIDGVQQIRIPDVNGLNYNAYLWPSGGDAKNLILYFGGNGEFAASAIGGLARTPGVDQLLSGYRVLMVDYPGYGLSEGSPGEESIYRMALAAWDYVKALPEQPAKIVLMGYSLGTGTAARLADEREPDGLVLLAPYYSGARLVDDFLKVRLFDGPLQFLVRNEYKSYLYAKTTQTQALIIAARNDSLVPPAQAEALAEAYPNKRLVMVEGGHEAPRFGAEALSALGEYLRELKPPLILPQQP